MVGSMLIPRVKDRLARMLLEKMGGLGEVCDMETVARCFDEMAEHAGAIAREAVRIREAGEWDLPKEVRVLVRPRQGWVSPGAEKPETRTTDELELAGLRYVHRVGRSTVELGFGEGRMKERGGKLEALTRALLSGLGIRAAAREAGVNKETARKLHRALTRQRAARGEGPILCGCGSESTHRGWCTERE